MKEDQKRKEWEERAMNRLEDANQTVIQIFKLDKEADIQKNVIEGFLEKGDKNYQAIFGTFTKFATDVDKSLTGFRDAILTMTSYLKELKGWKPEQSVRVHKIKDSDDEAQARRRKGKLLPSGSSEDRIRPNLEKKHVEEKKLKKEEISGTGKGGSRLQDA
jgi:hypothetical protein